MDEKPFLTINLLELKERDLGELKKFKKEALDVDSILSSAENLKYTQLIKDWLEKEMAEPSADLVKLIIANVYDGVKTQNHFMTRF